jgi:hypothetical protein
MVDIASSTTPRQTDIMVMCAYKFNVDDGIAVVFRNGTLENVGTQNIIL